MSKGLPSITLVQTSIITELWGLEASGTGLFGDVGESLVNQGYGEKGHFVRCACLVFEIPRGYDADTVGAGDLRVNRDGGTALSGIV